MYKVNHTIQKRKKKKRLPPRFAGERNVSQKLPKETQNKEAANALEKGNSRVKERENRKKTKRERVVAKEEAKEGRRGEEERRESSKVPSAAAT